MNPSEKLNSPHAPALARLKEKWRTLQKSEQDYWRAQFNSSRTSKSIRGEMAARLRVMLIHDVQLTHFRKWLARQDMLEAAAEKIHEDLSNLAAPEFKNPGGGPCSGAVRWLYYQCLQDLEKRALDLLVRGKRLTDDFYYDALCICTLAWLEEASPRNYLN